MALVFVFLISRIICSTIPLCFAIQNFPNLVCPLFPPELPCECPIKAGTYNSPNAVVKFDEKWLAIDGGINVRNY